MSSKSLFCFTTAARATTSRWRQTQLLKSVQKDYRMLIKMLSDQLLIPFLGAIKTVGNDIAVSHVVETQIRSSTTILKRLTTKTPCTIKGKQVGNDSYKNQRGAI